MFQDIIKDRVTSARTSLRKKKTLDTQNSKGWTVLNTAPEICDNPPSERMYF